MVVDDRCRGKPLIGFLRIERLHLASRQLLQLNVSETGNDMQVQGFPVALIGAGTQAPPMRILKPVG